MNMRSYLWAAVILTGSVFALYPAMTTFALIAGIFARLVIVHRQQNRMVMQRIPVKRESASVRRERQS